MISAEQRARQRQVVLDTLAAGPADIHQLALALGLTKVAARRHLEPLRIEPRQVRISHWIDGESESRKYPRPYYALGSEPDALKPPPLQKAWTRRAKSKAPPIPAQNSPGPFAALFN